MQTPTSRISAKLLDQLLITIRERLESGETIRKALCEQAGISPSYLSRILSEGFSNRTLPSRTLKQIVSAVEPKGLSGFIRRTQGTSFCIRRQNDAAEVSRGLFPDCTAADLSRGFVGRTRFPFLLTRFAADDSATTQSYFLPSERFLYVLNGELSLHTTATDSPSQLQAGDAVYIPEFQPHWITSRNRTTKAITVLWDLQGVRPQALYTRGGMRLSHKTNADAVTRNSLDGDSEYWRMVGLRIQALRTRCGLTQELLAELCGLPDSELRQIESGRRAPSLEKLLVIGSMLRVSDLSDLLTDLAVDIVPAQPTEADSAAIAQLSAQLNRSLPQVVYVVKVQLKSKPPATSLAWRACTSTTNSSRNIGNMTMGFTLPCSTHNSLPTIKDSDCASPLTASNFTTRV